MAPYRNQLLAEAIPALSLPAGANQVNNIPHTDDSTNRNFHMPDFVAGTFWPSERGFDSSVANWHHSDIRVVAYPYLYQFFDQLVNIATP